MTHKLHVYGAIARALYYQRYRRTLQRRADLLSLGTVNRWFPAVYEWWNA
jgi:hypothetical protein